MYRHPFVGEKVVDVISQFSPPTRFGRQYRDALARARHVRVCLHANVVDIETDGATSIRCVKIRTLSGREATVGARLFVLAAGGIENARILLACNRERPRGLGNDNDLVGRFFMDHPRLTTGKVKLRGAHARNMLYDIKYHYQNKAVAAFGTCFAAQFRLSEAVRAREGLLAAASFSPPTFRGNRRRSRTRSSA